LEHLHEVELVPVLDDHAVLDAPDVDAAYLDGFAGGGDAHQVSGVGAALLSGGVSGRHPVGAIEVAAGRHADSRRRTSSSSRAERLDLREHAV
jgi:hypothetical protein